jgi:hypothetical protein
LILLSMSATKRPIYMQPVLPAFALMCVAAWEKISENKAIKGYFLFWVIICAFILGILTVTPFFNPLFSHKISPAAAVFLANFSLRNALTAIGFVLCLIFCFTFRRDRMSPSIVVIATTLAYIGLFIIPVKAIDLEKSMKSDIKNFVAKIPLENRVRAITYEFSETIQGCFYYYCDWTVQQTNNDQKLQQILAGKDPAFDSIIVNIDQPHQKALEIMNNLFKTPYRIIAEQYTGGKRGLFWIKGA